MRREGHLAAGLEQTLVCITETTAVGVSPACVDTFPWCLLVFCPGSTRQIRYNRAV